MSSRRTVKNRNATSCHFRELRPSSSSGTLFANLPASFVMRLAPFRNISEDKKLTEARISIPLIYFAKRPRWYRELSGYLNLVYTYRVTDESIGTLGDFFFYGYMHYVIRSTFRNFISIVTRLSYHVYVEVNKYIKWLFTLYILIFYRIYICFQKTSIK